MGRPSVAVCGVVPLAAMNNAGIVPWRIYTGTTTATSTTVSRTWYVMFFVSGGEGAFLAGRRAAEKNVTYAQVTHHTDQIIYRSSPTS